MSERPTPETNKRIDEREPKDTNDLIQELYAADRHCRRLERERDALADALKWVAYSLAWHVERNAQGMDQKHLDDARAALAQVRK